MIVAAFGAIVYVLQWKEPTGAKPPDSPAESQKAALPKSEKELPPPKAPAEKKEKKADVKSEIVLPQRQIAIIIDDIGNDLDPVEELLKTNLQLTFAILPLCRYSRESAELLHKAGREILLHLPMEPMSYPREKPGEGALFTDMNEKEILLQLEKNLSSVPHASGVNNHMGSKFMTDEDKLELVFNWLKKKKLFFVDSLTTSNSKASPVAQKVGLSMSSRRIFLDNNRNYQAIYKQLLEVAEKSAENNDLPVIVIGHPYPETIRAIKDAQGLLQAKGVSVVPVSRLVGDNRRQISRQ